MTDPPSARPPGVRPAVHTLTVSASRPLADVLLDLACAPNTLPLLAVLWAAVIWLGTQVPQLHAADMATDGLPRSELLALHALGLDALAWSLAVWLLGGLTAFAALAILLAQRPRWRAEHALLVVALPTVLGAWARATAGAPPVSLDVVVGADLATVPAAMADGGGPAPAPGRWQAQCQRRAGSETLDCAVEGAGLRHRVTLASGAPAVDQGEQITWMATSSAPAPTHMTLNWRAKPGDPAIFAVALEQNAQAEAPSLSVHLQPQLSTEAGPLVLVTDRGAAPTVRLLASPDVLPRAPATALVAGQDRVRIQVAPSRPGWPLVVAFLGLGAVFLRALRRPASRAEASQP